jgi:hypothetical protein
MKYAIERRTGGDGFTPKRIERRTFRSPDPLRIGAALRIAGQPWTVVGLAGSDPRITQNESQMGPERTTQ